MIDPQDVVEKAAMVFRSEGHEEPTYEPTGPEAVTFERVAQKLSGVTGQQVEFVPVPDDAARENLIAEGCRTGSRCSYNNYAHLGCSEKLLRPPSSLTPGPQHEKKLAQRSHIHSTLLVFAYDARGGSLVRAPNVNGDLDPAMIWEQTRFVSRDSCKTATILRLLLIPVLLTLAGSFAVSAADGSVMRNVQRAPVVWGHVVSSRPRGGEPLSFSVALRAQVQLVRLRRRLQDRVPVMVARQRFLPITVLPDKTIGLVGSSVAPVPTVPSSAHAPPSLN